MAGKLSDYVPPTRERHVHALEAFENAHEFVAQAQALRGDMLDREAKLRQAADLANDATARADAVLYALDEKKRLAERAAEAATQARVHAKEMAEACEARGAELTAAVGRAREIRSAADEISQEHNKIQAEIDAARFDLQAFLEDIRLGREELQSLKSQSRPFGPSAAPGTEPGAAPGAAPGAFPTVPPLYPAGPTVLGFLYDLVTNAATGSLQLTGGTMTGELDVNITSGPSLAFAGTAQAHSGAFGLSLNKAKTLNTNPHSVIWKIGGSPTWEVGQDFDTNNADNGGTGNSDFIVVYDHTANAGAGADIMRFSPAEKDTIGNPKSTKMLYGGVGVGTPRTNTHIWTVDAGTALGGLSMTINSQSARDHLTLVQAFATSKRAAINFNGLWKMGADIGGANTTEFILRDATNSLNRFYIENTANLTAKIGVNTTAPVGGMHSATSNDATLYDTVQTAFAAGFSTIANRTWLVQQILDATQAENFMFLMGGLGAGSTRALPVATSTSTPAFGVKANQTQMDLIAAPSGTNQTIVKGVSVAQTGGAPTVGLYGVTPVIRGASNEDLRTSLINLGAITGGVNPLNTNGGALTVGAVAASGAHSGSGSSFQFARIAYTYASDADATLSVTEKTNVILDIQAGVVTAGRNLDVVAPNAGGFWIVINRTAQIITIKIGANPGIAVAATRARMMCAPGGTTMFALTPDTVYTV